MANAEYIPAEILELMELGKNGKLWTLTIVYTLDGETRSIKHRNQKNEQIMTLREDIFRYGFIHPVAIGSWRIVCPIDIDRVELDRQTGYFSG